MSANSNWEEREDGWHKKDNSQTQGNAHYFSRPIPPVRDAATGFPIGKDGKVDWERLQQERAEQFRKGNT
jgi:hypothetical protein